MAHSGFVLGARFVSSYTGSQKGDWVGAQSAAAILTTAVPHRGLLALTVFKAKT